MIICCGVPHVLADEGILSRGNSPVLSRTAGQVCGCASAHGKAFAGRLCLGKIGWRLWLVATWVLISGRRVAPQIGRQGPQG